MDGDFHLRRMSEEKGGIWSLSRSTEAGPFTRRPLAACRSASARDPLMALLLTLPHWHRDHGHKHRSPVARRVTWSGSAVRRWKERDEEKKESVQTTPRATSSSSAPPFSSLVNGPVAVDLASLTDDEAAWLAAQDEFRVLVLGKTGVGKSSLINAIANANAVVGRLEVGTRGVTCYENTLIGDDDRAVRVAVFDAPGFFDVEARGCSRVRGRTRAEGRTPAGVLRELSANVDDYHVIVYAQPSTDRRVRLEDEQSITFVVQALGAEAASRTVVALTYANELKDEAEVNEVTAVKAKQMGELFDAAVATVGGGRGRGGEAASASSSSSSSSTSSSSSLSGGVPAVAVGAGGDGTGWESTLWISLMRRAQAAAAAAGLKPPADAQRFSVDWDALRAAGVVTESKPPPPPPPPLELVRAYVDTALGEFDNALQRRSAGGGDAAQGQGRVLVADDLVQRSVFAVKQRGMPAGFAATVILEVRGPLEGRDPSALTNQLCMLMPGSAKNSVMKVRMGSIPAEDLPSPAALRRGGAEVTVGALSTRGGEGGSSGPVTYAFDPSDGSFTAGKGRRDFGDAIIGGDSGLSGIKLGAGDTHHLF